ncbi:MAG: YdeI/OmpD-associated family protein [Phycisphaerales bacterium]
MLPSLAERLLVHDCLAQAVVDERLLQQASPRRALTGAPAVKAGSRGARDVWSDITPAARRDWVHWIESAKQAVTRARRVAMAIDMLAKGKRRPCCFDRSGMYSKSLACPEAESEVAAD